MTGLKKFPITGPERERYWQEHPFNSRYIASHRNNKTRFGKQDILGSDIVFYHPNEIKLSQPSSVTNLSHKRAQLEKALGKPPVSLHVIAEAVGIDGYALGTGKNREIHITRIVVETWQADRTWTREEVDANHPLLVNGEGSFLKEKGKEGMITLGGNR